MVSEYIDKHDAIDAARHAWAKGLEPSQYIELIPSADVRQVVRGQWIYKGFEKGWECSICGSGCLLNLESDFHKSDFCPHCGADMKEDKE